MNSHLPKPTTKKKWMRESKVMNKDTKCIHDKCELCIYPLDPELHSAGLVNIVMSIPVDHIFFDMSENDRRINVRRPLSECEASFTAVNL